MEVGALPSGLGIFLACVLSWIRVYYGLLHLPGRPLVSIRNIHISRDSPLLYLFKVKLTLVDSPCIYLVNSYLPVQDSPSIKNL